MLKIENLSAFYGKKQVIFDLSAEFKSGRFTAILGRNGSGKSSLLSCIGGIKGYSGKILLGGRDISEIPSREHECERPHADHVAACGATPALSTWRPRNH
jgi:ABC-type cobalamin/Fe3+-siderophores transport system ATPase subunit